MTVQLGKANYAGGSAGNQGTTEKTRFYKLGHKEDKDRTLIVRIAPPKGKLAETGAYKIFRKVHFGYGIEVMSQKGDKFFVPQTFDCIETTDRDGTIKDECPECVERKARNAQLEKKKAELKAAGKTDEEILTATKHLSLWLREHNLDKKWWMLAKTQDGNWGVLTISYSCGKLFFELLKKLADKNEDPLSAEKGLWFKFSRSGSKFNDIVDTVEVYMEEQENGDFRKKYDSLTDADMNQLEKLSDLTDFGRKLTYTNIDMLVKSGGDEKIVRSVMDLPTPSSARTTASGATETKTETKPEPAVEKAGSSPSEDIVRTEMMRLLEEARKQKNGASMDDFLKQFQK